MAKDTFYFPHDYNARNDMKLQALIYQHGAIGYGLYWCIIEILHEEADHSIKFFPLTWTAIARQMSISVEHVLPVIDSCLEFGLLIKNGDYLQSPRVTRNIEKRKYIRDIKSKAGKKSAQARKYSTDVQHVSTDVQHNSTKERKERKERKEKIYKYPPPFFDEFIRYARENKPDVNTEGVKLKYKAWKENDWKDGNGVEIKNWKTKLLNTLPYIKEAKNGTEDIVQNLL